MRQRANLGRCSVIHVDRRGDVVSHLQQLLSLSDDQPLLLLEDLRLAIGLYDTTQREFVM